MEFHVITDQGVTHVCDVHRAEADLSPLQMISRDELARLKRAEVELETLRNAMVRALLAVPQA